MRITYWITAAALALTACGGGEDSPDRDGRTQDLNARTAGAADALASGSAELSPDELESGRLDPSWRQYTPRGRTTTPADTQQSRSAADPQEREARPASDTTDATWEDISPRTANQPATGLPIHGDVEGPSVLRVQVLLDGAQFSPGIIDGRWGKNTEKAVYWFQEANGLDATGEVDRATLDALQSRSGQGQIVTSHTLTEKDVQGPFVQLPEDIYERAAMDCTCYESLREKIGEVFHSSPELLEQLNPDIDLNRVSAGQTLQVPAVRPFHLADLPDGKHTGSGDVARIVISDGGHYLHAVDGSGKILYHFPSTLGADYAPSPTGDFSVTSITFDPTWHYQPELLTGEDPSKEDAVIPSGPNNAVGVVWMQLSKPHYGIHGTSAPETIGYATSHGCVRLTNWDAGLLGQRIQPDTPVEFTDVAGRGS